MSDPTLTAATVDEDYGGDLLATFEFTANLLADCPTFREVIIGVTNPADAKAKVYYQETLAEEDPDGVVANEGDPLPELEPRPYAIVLDIDGQRTRRRVGVGEWASEGRLTVVIEANIPNDLIVDDQLDGSAERRDKFRRRRRWGLEQAGKIEKEICDRSGGQGAAGGPFLNVHECELIVPPSDPSPDELDQDFIGWAYSLSWK